MPRIGLRLRISQRSEDTGTDRAGLAMNEIKYDQDFCGSTQQQARMPGDRRCSAVVIDNLVQEIETLGCSEGHEPVSLLRALRAYLLQSQFQPVRRGRRLLSLMRDKRVDARNRLAWNPRLRSQPDHGVTHARHLAVIDPKKQTGHSLRTLRSCSAWSFDQLVSYNLWFADA